MKETGILFTPENHRLIMSGAKVQTRRVMKPQPYYDEKGLLWWNWSKYRGCACNELVGSVSDEWFDHCPQGRVGDKLYIKEGIIVRAPGWTAITWKADGTLLGYYMDGRRVENAWDKRLTAMFMAKRYARTWLELTDVRVERLQDISEEDAIAEGIGDWTSIGGWNTETAKQAYAKLWDSINKKKHPWSSNLFCWCLSFKVVKP